MSSGIPENEFHNPYQTGDLGASTAATVPDVKPTSATVFGILNLIFGALGVCGLVVSSVVFIAPEAMQPPGAPPNPTLELIENNMVYRTFTIASLVLGVVATIVLIIGGIGLLQGQPFGRSLSIVYSVYALLMGVLGLVMNVAFIYGPLMEQIGDVPDGPEKAGAIGGLVGGGCGQCLGFIYPVVLLIFMFRPNVVAYFSKSH